MGGRVHPMPTLIVEHNVQDFNTWQAEFHGHEPTRRQYGITNPHIYRSAADPNRVCIIMQVESAGDVEDFMTNSDLQAVMEKAGVVGEPTINILDSVATITT